MKAKRQKINKRHLSVYIHSFGFRQPYQIIVDGNFIDAIRKTKRDANDALSKFLNGNVRIMTTYCCYTELKRLGPDFRVTAAHAKKLEKRRCTHSPAVPASQCIKDIIGENNQFRYAVATQDRELRAHLRSIPAVPLLYINNSVLILEPPSQATLNEANRLEVAKTLPRANEIAVTRNQEAALLDERPKKRKRTNEPNPLSMKRKKAKPSVSQAAVSRAGVAEPLDVAQPVGTTATSVTTEVTSATAVVPENAYSSTYDSPKETPDECEEADGDNEKQQQRRRRVHRGGRRKPRRDGETTPVEG